MAATWDAPLLGQVGEVVSTEARAKYNEAIRSIFFGLTIWSPNINIFLDSEARAGAPMVVILLVVGEMTCAQRNAVVPDGIVGHSIGT